jgi:hypothetical protein
LDKFEKEKKGFNLKHIILNIRDGDRSKECVIDLFKKFSSKA